MATNDAESRVLVDASVVKRLAALDQPGSPPFAHEVWQIFLDAAPGYVGEVEAAVRSGDMVLVKSAAHKLKGAAANVGAEATRQMALKIENLARDQQVAEVRVEVAKLVPMLDATRKAWVAFASG